jgi:hypothetical protein
MINFYDELGGEMADHLINIDGAIFVPNKTFFQPRI